MVSRMEELMTDNEIQAWAQALLGSTITIEQVKVIQKILAKNPSINSLELAKKMIEPFQIQK